MRRTILLLCAAVLLQGCVTADCDYLAMETEPRSAEPLKYPADVREPTASGEYRLPETKGAIDEDCLVLPPQTLPPEDLVDPDDLEDEGENPDDE